MTCNAVKLALKFYHDQVVYLPSDMNCGTKVDIPKSCPIVHSSRGGPTQRAMREHEKAITSLNIAMLYDGLGPWQQAQIEVEAARLEICSNRAKPGEHNPEELALHRELQYPRNMFSHVQNLKAFQSRDRKDMMPNVKYTDVGFGCGGPFSPECLTGWDAGGLLTQRLHLWSDATTHPKPCNNECFAGWNGADLIQYRQQTWAGDGLKKWGEKNYPKTSHEHICKHTKRSVFIRYAINTHPHNDQFDGNDKESKRKPEPPIGQAVYVLRDIEVPVSRSLYGVLHGLDPLRFPGPPSSEDVDHASIEDILGRLPEAFEAQDPSSREGSGPPVNTTQGSESGSTLVDEPVVEPEPVPVEAPEVTEAPEVGEARRQKAREVLREKLKRDFSN